MAKAQREVSLTLRLWDTNRHTDSEWYVSELERISGMIADGFTSGEIIGNRDETGWWEINTNNA